jgi:hypothetical protein
MTTGTGESEEAALISAAETHVDGFQTVPEYPLGKGKLEGR